ncbi:phosphate ABC transporter ATP-binding protein [Solibacillus sp. CAU 1738]|uniref:ABC transporter ATP-binding protein n=1 Tax=Solibacillus sp. CAU 1738 TaxID=3140363 RepID=UPI003260ECD7
MTAQYAIEFRNVCYKAGEQTILDNVSGQFLAGHITTLIGPSGAGKTTLLKMCNALLSPTSGAINIFGDALESFEPPVLRRKVGIVLQNAPILRTTVFENLALPRKLQHKSLSKDEALQALTDVGLDTSFLMHPANALSGGQKQKLAIARTLINDSDILLLDEITSALDPQSVHEIEELILKIQQKGVTIIWITHNIEQAKKIGDMTWMMARGKVIASGSSSEVFDSTDSRVQTFLGGGAK